MVRFARILGVLSPDRIPVSSPPWWLAVLIVLACGVWYFGRDRLLKAPYRDDLIWPDYGSDGHRARHPRHYPPGYHHQRSSGTLVGIPDPAPKGSRQERRNLPGNCRARSILSWVRLRLHFLSVSEPQFTWSNTRGKDASPGSSGPVLTFLTGTPSIVFGLFGFAFIVLYLGIGVSMLAGQVTLALMVLPTVIRTTEESLKNIPQSLREGSLALGATRWQTISRVVLPPAVHGHCDGGDSLHRESGRRNRPDHVHGSRLLVTVPSRFSFPAGYGAALPSLYPGNQCARRIDE